MEQTASAVISRCNELKRYWAVRDNAMKRWYRLVEQIDELATDKMESFVGNDPRALYNLVLHLLDSNIPHRIKDYDMTNFKMSAAVAEVGRYFKTAWQDAQDTYRHNNPSQSISGTFIGFMLSTGWYAMLSMMSDDGLTTYKEPWNPIDVYPMWNGGFGLDEVAHIVQSSTRQVEVMCMQRGWKLDRKLGTSDVSVYDYWWVEYSNELPYSRIIWNAIVVDNTLVKFSSTRFTRIPIYVSPVGGLPDNGSLTSGGGSNITLRTSGTREVSPERWKAEIGQSILATNENVYRAWNKWWTFSMQLLRDTAQPRIFERSRSGKSIVKPEDVFRRGAIFRGGPDDSVDFLSTPPIPLELRSTQLDLEAMMQRGGVSWAMHGTLQGQISAYVMSQIAASANQIMKPFHSAIISAFSDMDNDDLADIKNRGIRPYGWSFPSGLPNNYKVTAEYEVEIPGDLVQRATVARMLDPNFCLSYSYVVRKLFPDISDPMQERAQIRSDQAELHPSNSMIALIIYYRRQAAYLNSIGDVESAKLYELVADNALMSIQPESQEEQPRQIPQVPGLGNTQGVPQLPTGRRLRAAELKGG